MGRTDGRQTANHETDDVDEHRGKGAEGERDGLDAMQRDYGQCPHYTQGRRDVDGQKKKGAELRGRKSTTQERGDVLMT